MKFTAFITTTSANTVSRKLTQLDPTVNAPMGSERICSCPNQAMIPAATNCAPSLIIQSRSHRSSATPTSTMSRTAPRSESTGTGSVQKIEK